MAPIKKDVKPISCNGFCGGSLVGPDPLSVQAQMCDILANWEKINKLHNFFRKKIMSERAKN